MFRSLSYLYLKRLLSALMVLLTLAVVVGVSYSVWSSRHDILNQKQQEAQMQARMFGDQLTQMLNLTQITLQGASDQIDIRQPHAEINDNLAQSTRRLAFLRSVSFVVANQVWASSNPANVGVAYQDEDLLPPRKPSETASFLRIGLPKLGRDLSDGLSSKRPRVSQDWSSFFSVVREEPWRGERLRWVGVINPDYFVNAMSAHIDPMLTRVDVLRYDGAVLFSTSDSVKPADKVISNEWLHRLQEQEVGVDEDAMIAFRTSRSFPFFVVVRMDAEYALRAWRIQAQRTGAVALIILLVLWAIGALLMQRLRRDLAAEQSLQEARTLTARVFEGSSNGIMIADGQCRIVTINAKLEESLGLNRSEMVGMDLHDYLSNAQGREVCQQIQRTLEQSDAWRGEITDLKPNGERIHQWLTLSVVRNDEGEAINYVGVFDDLTQERKREGQIRRLSQAIEQSPTSILITDTDSVIEYVNPHFLTSTGYALDEVLGRTPKFLGSGLTPLQTFRDLWHTLQQGQTWQGELINRHRNGQVSYQRAIISPIRDAQAHITGYVAVELDVTEQRRQAQQLERARQEAEAASVAKSNFLANMSHEIRTPMNGIIGVSELMLSLPQDPELREHVQTVRNSARGLLGIINDILDFSKIEANKLQLESLPFSPSELVNDLLNLMRPAAQERALILSAHMPPDPLPILMGDPSRLRQILLNLLGNAIKFTSEGEVRIEVDLQSVEANQVNLAFSVRDTGIGMSPQVLTHLFSPFYQGDASMTRRFGGTGLGLSISHRLAKLMGGDLVAQSQVGHGSVFTLQLGLGIASAEEAQQIQEPMSDLPEGVRVLLVEDNPVNRKVAHALLGRLQCEVETVNDGEQALRYLQTHEVDMVLMDCQMPTMDGFEATRRIRAGEAGAQATQVRIIAMTAHAMQGDREACIAAGMNDYISKPVTLDELRKVLWRQLYQAMP